MAIRREWVTPLTAGAFLLSAVTGVLIFFHADSGLNREAHEWLSWVLLGAVGLHTVINFGALKLYLSSLRGQAVAGAFVLALLLSFIPVGGGDAGGPPFVPPLRALAAAPLSTVAQVARVSPEQLRARLAAAGVPSVSDQQTLNELIGPDLHKQVRVMAVLFAGAK